ncbi:coiled-coil domain-containing protein 55-domain containing protein [Sporodiniella umbellata]|nr:coiled-coil domain-containing protein 55-domain containing protein [Sporodiniella umbellata]
MQFGLNLQKKKTLSAPKVTRKSAFDDSSDEDESETQPKSASQRAKSQVNKQLSSYSTANKKLQEEHSKALEDDPNIFDYDAVYDDLKAAEKKKKDANKEPKEKKAKYIKGLLEMAEIRKRDRLLAEEKKVARERAEEGEEFADREVFVTETFKKQKEELERIEKEEKEREEKAAKGQTMDSFYKQMLERKEAEHQALMKAFEEKDKLKGKVQEAFLETSDSSLAKQAEKEGKEVMLNDSNEIVDKRQLLGAGLNVKPKFGTLGSLAASDERIQERMNEYEAYKRKKVEDYENKRKQGKDNGERERLSREVEKQMVEVEKKKAEEEERKRKELEQKATAKRTTEDVAMSARERYLARKKQKLEEEKK